MIVSQTNLKLSNWMCLAVFLLAIGVLPIGLVYAQDYEAVQKRLVEAVKSGDWAAIEAKVRATVDAVAAYRASNKG